jgi:DNA-binding IscR family transcriptional regulator
MATAEFTDCLQQVGEVAGEVWHCLSHQGPMSNAKLAKEIDAPRDVVMQAVGWLAREGKVMIIEGSRGRTIELV